MNWYLVTNVIAAATIFLFLLAALVIERFRWKLISTKHIAITALLISISVILTNLLSYNIPILPGGTNLALGDWILFLLGTIFGPIVGWIGAVTSDSLGALVNIGGTYHVGFMLDKVILSFLGSLVFIFKKNNLLAIKIIFAYIIALALESFILNPIWMYASGWGDAVFVNMIVKLIKYPIVLPIYCTFVIVSLMTINSLLVRWQGNTYVWCLRHGFFWQFSKNANKVDKIKGRERSGINHE